MKHWLTYCYILVDTTGTVLAITCKCSVPRVYEVKSVCLFNEYYKKYSPTATSLSLKFQPKFTLSVS